MKQLLFSVFIMAIFITGCSEKEQLSDSAEIAKSFLEEKGYKVTTLIGESSGKLTQERLERIPEQQAWAVQPINPDEYIGKIIDRVQFVVNNHPLNEIYDGEINVIVFVSEKSVIGGISFAVNTDGGPHYLDGSLN